MSINKLYHLIRLFLIPILFILIGFKSFIELTDDYFENDLEQLDAFSGQFIEATRTPAIISFMKMMTQAGERHVFIAIFFLILILLYNHRHLIRRLLTPFLVLIVASGISLITKDLIKRPRPTGKHHVEINSHSFPSGHAISATAFYGTLALALLKTKLKSRIFFSIIAILIIALVCLSRLYLGVHYLSDVLAGCSVGIFLLGITHLVININEVNRPGEANLLKNQY